MKKLLRLLALSWLAWLPISQANSGPLTRTGQSQFGGLLSNETALASTKTYVLDLAQYNASRVSAIVSYASATLAPMTFSDGQQSTGSITVAANPATTWGGYLTIGSTQLVAGKDFSIGATAALTATNISASINANPTLNAVIASSASSSLVTATATTNGTAGNLAWSSYNSSILRLSSSSLTGGLDSAYSLNGSAIKIPNHRFSTALAVLFSTAGILANGGQLIGGLVSQTTYYVIPLTPNDIALATTSLRAVSNQPLLTTSSATAHISSNTYTLTALPLTGNTSFYWEVGNDSSTFVSLNISSYSIGSLQFSTVPISIGWDFGPMDFQYIRLNAAGPSTGGVLLKTQVNAKGDER